MAESQLPIPAIDLSPIHSGDPVQAAMMGKEIFAAFTEFGFAYVTNHGISQEIADEAFTWAVQSSRFFALSQEDKEKAPHPPEGWYHRGYSCIGREKVSQMVFDRDAISELRKVPDLKETFDLGRENDEHTPNIWPPEEILPGFRAFFARFYELCYVVELDLLRAIAIGMGLDELFFHTYHREKHNQIRLLHYPPVEEELLRKDEAVRLGAHTDFGTMTFLFQDGVGGLEVEDPKESGKFNPVPYMPEAIVVNVGDFLQRWSNDALKSTMHRVRAPPSVGIPDGQVTGRIMKARFSIPYFVGADHDKTIDCIPGCFGPDRPKKYEPINAREYVEMRLNATY